MAKKKTKLQLTQDQVQAAIDKTNQRIDALGERDGEIFDALNRIQALFDIIRNIPTETKLKYEELKKVRLNWKDQVNKIEEDYQKAAVKNAGAGVAGVGAGVAVAALGPTAAMGIATTFGVASTGTAISALSGAAATNAALAWLGGGALAAGGGGMAAGNALLALAGPIGWAIAGVAVVSSSVLFIVAKNEQKRLENIFTLIGERDIKSYELAMVELNERIQRIVDETAKLNQAIGKIQTFGTDYNEMSEAQQYELGAYVNLMSSSTQLLINPILGLQPNYSEEDFEQFLSTRSASNKENNTTEEAESKTNVRNKLILVFANLLYSIDLDKTDCKLLAKSFKKNKKFLSEMGISKQDFDQEIIDLACEALKQKGLA